MMTSRIVRPVRPLLAMTAALVVAGCAGTLPAPVVNRTPPPAQPIPQPPVSGALPPGPQPGATTGPLSGQVPAGQLPGPLPGQAPGGVVVTPIPGGVESSPIRSGSIEPGAVVPSAPVVDPNLKTGPKGFKRPFGEMAAVDPRLIERPGAIPAGVPTVPAAAGSSPRPPVNVATAPAAMPPTQTPTPQAAPSAAPAATGTGRLDGVTFGWPAAGTVIQTFNDTSSKGLSLGGRAGDAIVAAADGRVIFSGAGPRGYGNLVIVKHSNDLLSVYAHNRSLAVKEGDSVKRGQKIAELGNSGTDKPKLHFEIRQQGKPIDPLAVLPKR